jgi:glutamine amidotransferase-like uncharacterized protein
VHFILLPTAAGPRLQLLVVSLVLPFTLASCGTNAGGSQTSLPSSGPPPPIPSAQPVLLFDGIGTSSTDVAAVEAVLGTLSIGYATADSARLNGMTEPQLAGYKLLIVPGGDSTVIGGNLSPGTAANIHGAVIDYGLHYLGICAGAFFGGYSIYNGVDLTGGVYFSFYQDEFKGIHTEAVEISLTSGEQLDVYWQDGPQLSGWGQVVAKFPDSTPAIAEGLSGKGFVIFTGVHLEAPANWRGSMQFSTPVSVDLAYAATVMQAAFDGTPLPHF